MNRTQRVLRGQRCGRPVSRGVFTQPRPLADVRPHRPICAEVVGRANAQTDPDELFRRIVHIAPPPIRLGEAA